MSAGTIRIPAVSAWRCLPDCRTTLTHAPPPWPTVSTFCDSGGILPPTTICRGRDRRMNEMVDVLIIGSGASGAAAAWSLADTRMKILCLEQGDWMKQSDYPSNGRDYEARLFSDYATSPNIRQRPSDYPINDDNSPIKVVNFNAVGGSTVMYTAHYPRLP